MMAFTEDQHELLPWYVTGKLDPRETERFREHLDGCPACREELAFLQSVQVGTDEYGDGFFLEHPTADRLVDFALGRLADEQSGGIRQHLELCDLCAAEARWVRGEEAVGGEDLKQPLSIFTAQPRRRSAPIVQWGGWAAAAAASVLLALVVWQQPETPKTGPETHQLIQTERADTRTTRFTRGDRWPRVVVEIDLPGSAFPVTVEVSRVPDGVVFHDDAIERSDLVGELSYVYDCREDCRPGKYEIRITGSDPDEPVLEYEFEVAPESPQSRSKTHR